MTLWVDATLQLLIASLFSLSTLPKKKKYWCLFFCSLFKYFQRDKSQGCRAEQNNPQESPMNPSLLFSSLDTYYYHFKLTNKGRRAQQLFWMNEDFCPQEKLNKKKLAKKDRAKSQPQVQCCQAPREPHSPVFQLHPVRMELSPGQTIDVILEGYSTTPRVRGCHV